MYYNQELGLCIEFGPVRVDSVRRGGGGPPPWIKSPLRRFTPSWTSTRVTCDCLLPFVHPLLSQVASTHLCKTFLAFAFLTCLQSTVCQQNVLQDVVSHLHTERACARFFFRSDRSIGRRQRLFRPQAIDPHNLSIFFAFGPLLQASTNMPPHERRAPCPFV